MLAAAADIIALAPPATWEVIGLHAAPLFLRDTLAKIGVEFDVVQIAPWKTAMDTLSQSAMSDEHRAQLTWLLESFFTDIVTAIARGRNLPSDEVKALIDRAPLPADEALAAGLADLVCYEDELAARLNASAENVGAENNSAEDEGHEAVKLAPYDKIHKLLWRRPRQRNARAIGVLTLSGAIGMGDSRRFPIPLPIFGEQTIGSRSVQQQIRAVRKQDHLAAVVVHVDSPGGSALASDLIWRE
ncbi:MAG: signal peptide peptidase SppA, partial [Caldilineaceae bacterium]|nr:signal peptide peptidase SppA [Caldilineaceae bacterium]